MRVYKPITAWEIDGNNGRQLEPDVSGYVVLSRHYFNGTNIIMRGYVFGYNRSENNIQVEAWFRHTEYEGNERNANPTGWKEESEGPGDPLRLAGRIMVPPTL